MTWDLKPDYVARPLGPREFRDWKWDGFGCCIYCRDTTRSRNGEHVIPEGLGSFYEIKDASCTKCTDETHAFEGRALDDLRPMRLNLHRPGRPDIRLKRSSPQTIEVVQAGDDAGRPLTIGPDDYPAMGHFPIFLPPRAITGLSPHVGRTPVRMGVTINKEGKAFDDVFVRPRLRMGDFARMIVKIAYCFATASLGLDAFHSRAHEYITGSVDFGWDYFVGNYDVGIGPPDPTAAHRMTLTTINASGLLSVVVRIRLFANVGAPEYDVYLGPITGVGWANPA